MSKHWVLVTLVLATYVQMYVEAQTPPGWRMVWNDEFDGTSIDRTKWQNEVDCWGGGNNELQCYTARSDNSFVENGYLVLQAKQERYTGSQQGCTSSQGCTNTKDYTSARLRTRMDPNGSWKYGRFEIRAKLPNGKHLWPAIWMLPTDYVYGSWAASGEIDIMEARGQEPKIFSSALHYGGVWPNNRYTTTGKQSYQSDLTSDWNTYVLEWEEKEIRIYINNTNTWTINLDRSWYGGVGPNPYSANGQPWNQRFHLILNVAIGGGFFPASEYGSMTAQDAQNWARPTMLVDYVRVYTRDTRVTEPSLSSSTSGGVVPTTSGSEGSSTTGSSCIVDADITTQNSQNEYRVYAAMHNQQTRLAVAQFSGSAGLVENFVQSTYNNGTHQIKDSYKQRIRAIIEFNDSGAAGIESADQRIQTVNSFSESWSDFVGSAYNFSASTTSFDVSGTIYSTVQACGMVANPTEVFLNIKSLANYVTSNSSKIAIEVRYNYYQDVTFNGQTKRTSFKDVDMSNVVQYMFGVTNSTLSTSNGDVATIVSPLTETGNSDTEKRYTQYITLDTNNYQQTFEGIRLLAATLL